jgi:hypothetical protein
MRIVVYDQVGEIALDYDTRSDTLSLCPGRLEKAQVVEALQEAAFFVMDAPAPPPEGRNFREHVFEGDQGE